MKEKELREIPKEEQPYELPDGWNWKRLKDINQYHGRNVLPQDEPEREYELYSVPSSANNYPEILHGKEIGSSKQSVEVGDVLLCKINPRINRVWQVTGYTEHELLASSEWIVVRVGEDICSDFLMYCFQSPYFRELMLSNISGVGGSLMRARPKFVETYPVPLPSIEEQRRIVACIERLFAHLDAAEQKVRQVREASTRRQQSLLHQAFHGELTKKWREAHEIGEKWERDKFDNLVAIMQNGLSKRSGAEGEDIVVLRLADLSDTGVDLKQARKIKLTQKEQEKYLLNTNDVLMIRVNGSSENVGKQILLHNGIDNPMAFCDHLIRIRYDEKKILPELMVYFSRTTEYRNYLDENMVSSAGQNTISRKGMRNLTVPIPSPEEQHEIVRCLDGLMTHERRIASACGTALRQIEALRTTILARAFRGEL